MNVGDPNGTSEIRLLPRESDIPVVVKITGKVKPEGAKGHHCKWCFEECKLNSIDCNKSVMSWSRGIKP